MIRCFKTVMNIRLHKILGCFKIHRELLVSVLWIWLGVTRGITRTNFVSIFVFAPCIKSIKVLFIIPTDAHNYKIIGMLKTIKIPTIASPCFGSRRNHHQGAISCLAKTTILILLCSSLMTWSMLWRHTSLLCKRAVHGGGRNFLMMVPA